jgi:hypothetical protein
MRKADTKAPSLLRVFIAISPEGLPRDENAGRARGL